MKQLVIILLVAALGAGVYYAYTQSDIDLSHPNGDNPLTAQAWQWTGTTYADESTMAPEQSSDFVARFTADGQFTSATDCNTIIGSYELEDTSLSFGQLAITEIACTGETLELEYLSDLEQVEAMLFTEDGQVLNLETKDGGMMHYSPNN